MREVSSLSVVVPAYNEAGTVEQVVRGIDAVLSRWPGCHEIIVVDDGSADRTGEIVERVAGELPRVQLIRMPSNGGYGAAQRQGLQRARSEFVCVLPADGQIAPSELETYLRAAGRADVIVGAYRIRQDTIARRLSSLLYNTTMLVLFGVRLRNINAPKLYRRADLDTVSVRSNGGFADAEIVIQLHARGRSFEEVEVSCLPRTAGRSSTGWKAAAHAVVELVRFRRSSHYRAARSGG